MVKRSHPVHSCGNATEQKCGTHSSCRSVMAQMRTISCSRTAQAESVLSVQRLTAREHRGVDRRAQTGNLHACLPDFVFLAVLGSDVKYDAPVLRELRPEGARWRITGVRTFASHGVADGTSGGELGLTHRYSSNPGASSRMSCFVTPTFQVPGVRRRALA